MCNVEDTMYCLRQSPEVGTVLASGPLNPWGCCNLGTAIASGLSWLGGHDSCCDITSRGVIFSVRRTLLEKKGILRKMERLASGARNHHQRVSVKVISFAFNSLVIQCILPLSLGAMRLYSSCRSLLFNSVLPHRLTASSLSARAYPPRVSASSSSLGASISPKTFTNCRAKRKRK